MHRNNQLCSFGFQVVGRGVFARSKESSVFQDFHSRYNQRRCCTAYKASIFASACLERCHCCVAYILLKYLQAKATYKWNMSNLSNFLRMASFAKIHLFDWLDHPVEVEKPPPEEQIQLAL
jgi:hypothetical protein